MNPGMSEQVATLRYQQMVAWRLQGQFVASVLLPLGGAPAVRTVLKQQFGALLMRVRVRFQDVHAAPEPWLAQGAVSERGARTSSDEPIYWLSPCRLP
jgi:hypothetical protein